MKNYLLDNTSHLMHISTNTQTQPALHRAANIKAARHTAIQLPKLYIYLSVGHNQRAYLIHRSFTTLTK